MAIAGWTRKAEREAEREASKAVTAVAVEVVVVACCPTSELAREDATEADEAVKGARRAWRGERGSSALVSERQRHECMMRCAAPTVRYWYVSRETVTRSFNSKKDTGTDARQDPRTVGSRAYVM